MWEFVEKLRAHSQILFWHVSIENLLESEKFHKLRTILRFQTQMPKRWQNKKKRQPTLGDIRTWTSFSQVSRFVPLPASLLEWIGDSSCYTSALADSVGGQAAKLQFTCRVQFSWDTFVRRQKHSEKNSKATSFVLDWSIDWLITSEAINSMRASAFALFFSFRNWIYCFRVYLYIYI